MEIHKNKDKSKEFEFGLFPLGQNKKLGASAIKMKRILIGRAHACDIRVPFPDVTSIHAVIEVIGQGIFKIYDMNSTNGTYINGEKVINQEVRLGDTISFAGHSYCIKKMTFEDLLPPPLEMLNPQKKAELPNIPNKVVAVNKSQSRRLPVIEYPLSKDPRAEFSEYIFEDADDLMPIFHYQTDKSAVEVIIVHKDRIHSVDYLPERDGDYSLVGETPTSKEIEYPYLGKTEKWPIVSIRNNQTEAHLLPGYDATFVGEAKRTMTVGTVDLVGEEILRFSNGDIQIYVRRSQAPPKVDPAPIFNKDKDLRKYLLLLLLFTFTFLGAVLLYPVDKELEEEKAPERIATILYKKRFVKIKEKPIPRPKTNEKKIQKPKPKVTKVKPKITKKVENTVIKKTKKAATSGKKGSKKAKKTGIVKKATPNKGPKTVIKDKVAPKKSTPKKTVGSRNSKSNTKARRRQNLKSKGPVDTYKSADFKNSLNSLLAKGGNTSRSAQTSGSQSNIGDTSLTAADSGATLETAQVKNNVGSMTGAARGRLDTSKGTGDLVDKKQAHFAGLPYRTVVLGNYNKDWIKEVLNDAIPLFRSCYQKELDVRKASFNGIVKLSFIIGASGHVSKAGVTSVSALPNSVKGCAINVLRGLRFPPPVGGGIVEVNLPMNFYPKTR